MRSLRSPKIIFDSWHRESFRLTAYIMWSYPCTVVHVRHLRRLNEMDMADPVAGSAGDKLCPDCVVSSWIRFQVSSAGTHGSSWHSLGPAAECLRGRIQSLKRILWG